jgi:hypothetical protein
VKRHPDRCGDELARATNVIAGVEVSDCDETLEARLRQSLRVLRRASRAPWRPWGRGGKRRYQRAVLASMARETAARERHANMSGKSVEREG